MNEQMERPVNAQTEGVQQEGWKMIPGGVHRVLMHESMQECDIIIKQLVRSCESKRKLEGRTHKKYVNFT